MNSTGADSNFEVLETLRDGSTILLRAIRPDDKEALREGFRQLTPRTIQWRFFGAKSGLTERELAYLTEIDYDHHMGLVGQDEHGDVVAVGRYVADAASTVAELAFVVGEPFQGRGIATVMLKHLRNLARAHGLTSLVALVQPDNVDMIDVFDRAGFALGWNEERTLRTASLSLQ